MAFVMSLIIFLLLLGSMSHFFFFLNLNSISYNTSAVFSVSQSSSGCQSEKYRFVCAHRNLKESYNNITINTGTNNNNNNNMCQ